MKLLFYLSAVATPVFGATSYTLPGNAEYGNWELRRANYNNNNTALAIPLISINGQSYPASGNGQSRVIPWSAPIAASATSANFTRTSGPGYFISSGSGIYDFMASSRYVIADSAPLLNMANLLFQARTNNFSTDGMGNIGGGFSSLTLFINGNLTGISPSFSTSALVTATAADDSDFAWQWDLSAYAGTINSYELVINTNADNIIYGNNNMTGESPLTTISASDQFVQAIPEPATAWFSFAALTLTLIRGRRA